MDNPWQWDQRRVEIGRDTWKTGGGFKNNLWKFTLLVLDPSPVCLHHLQRLKKINIKICGNLLSISQHGIVFFLFARNPAVLAQSNVLWNKRDEKKETRLRQTAGATLIGTFRGWISNSCGGKTFKATFTYLEELDARFFMKLVKRRK